MPDGTSPTGGTPTTPAGLLQPLVDIETVAADTFFAPLKALGVQAPQRPPGPVALLQRVVAGQSLALALPQLPGLPALGAKPTVGGQTGQKTTTTAKYF